MKTKTYMGVKLTDKLYKKLVGLKALRKFCIEYKRNSQRHHHSAEYVCSSLFNAINWSNAIGGATYWKDLYLKMYDAKSVASARDKEIGVILVDAEVGVAFTTPPPDFEGDYHTTRGDIAVVIVNGVILTLEFYEDLVYLDKVDEAVAGIRANTIRGLDDYIFDNISTAFNWRGSEEGREYWRQIHHAILVKNEDPRAILFEVPEEAAVGLPLPAAGWWAESTVTETEPAVELFDEELPEEEEDTIIPPQVPVPAPMPQPAPAPVEEIVEPPENYTGAPINEQEVL